MRKIEKAGYSPIMQFPKDRDMQEGIIKLTTLPKSPPLLL